MTAFVAPCRAVITAAGWLVGLLCLLLAVGSWLATAGASMFR